MRTLFHHPLSPTCRKVRILLGEKKLDFNLELERTWKKRPEFLELNPSGDIPVLRDLNNTVICESYPICEYLEEAYPDQPAFIGDSVLEKAEIRRLVVWFDHKFEQEVTRKIVFEKVFKRHFGLGHSDGRVIREGATAIDDHLTYIEWLLEHRVWLGGQHFSLADISAAAHLSAIDFLGDVPWDRYLEAKDWYARIKSRPSFRPLLKDQVPGITPPRHYDDLDF